MTQQVTRTKEQRCSVLRDFGHQAEQGSMSLKPTTSSPMALLPLTPHGVRETSALQPFRVQGVGHGERNVPSNPDYFSSHGDPCTPNTPQQADPGEQLGGTPEEEEKAEGPRWNDDDDSVCGTPETDDSDLYCSDEEEEGIRFTADTHKEKVEVACDEDSEYSIERVFVNRYLSNSVTHTDHVSPSPVKVATSEARSREEVTCDVGIVGGSRNKNTQSNLCSSSTASHTYTKSNGTRDQYTNHCPDSVVCLSGRALRMDDPVLQLDNQLRKARLTFASLRAEIKTNL